MNFCKLIIYLFSLIACMKLLSAINNENHKSTLYVIEVIYAEASGNLGCMWEQANINSTNRTASNLIQQKYHKKAAQFIWTWFDLGISVGVTRVMEKAINQSTNSKLIKPINSVQNVSLETMKILLDQFEEIAMKEKSKVHEYFKNASALLDEQSKPDNKYYVWKNLLKNWPYSDNNPRPNILLHMQFIILATTDFDRNCYDFLAEHQDIAKVTFYMATKSNPTISKSVISTYHDLHYYAKDKYNNPTYLRNASGNGQCVTEDKPLANFVIDPALHCLVTDLSASDIYKVHYEVQMEEMVKGGNSNPKEYQ